MATTVSHNEAAERYEIFLDGALAGWTEAHPHGAVVAFPHTEIHSEFAGHGLATQVIQAALDDVRSRGLKIHATCPFVLEFLEKHPEYGDLVAA